MAASMVHRPAEEGAVREFLQAAASGPSALLIDGDPGIGKTTLWSAACEWARERGFVVLAEPGGRGRARIGVHGTRQPTERA